MNRNRQSKVETVIIGALFLLAVVILAPILGVSSAGGDIKKVPLNQLQDGGEVIIKWPSTRGITVNLGGVAHDNYLDIHLSPFDTYKIEFSNGDDSESIYINTGVDAAGDQAYQKILHLVPAYIAQSGYRRITLYPINGDGIYAINHLSTEALTDPPLKANFAGYQIIDFDIPKLEFEIKAKDYQKIEEKRKEALALGIHLADPSDYVPARVRFGGHNYKTEVRLKGDLTDHINTDKWSLRVEVKGGESILGMEEFSIQRQETRNGLWTYLINEMYREQGGIALRYMFVDVVVNGQYKGVYALEEGFTKLAVEHSLFRESPILKFNEYYLWEKRAYVGDDTEPLLPFWVNLEPFNQKKTLNSPSLSGYAQYGIDLLDRVVRREIVVEDAFDLEKSASYAAIMDVFATSHGNFWNNMRFYINPVTGKLEPIPFDDLAFYRDSEDFYLYQKDEEIINQMMENHTFLELYFQEITNLSANLEQFLERYSDQIDLFTYIIRRDNGNYSLVIKDILQRKEDIKDLYVDHGVRCTWQSAANGYTLLIDNANPLPTLVETIHLPGSQLSFEQALPYMLDFKVDKEDSTSIAFTSDRSLNAVDRLTLEYRLFTTGKTYTTTCEMAGVSILPSGDAADMPAALVNLTPQGNGN